MCGFFLFFFLSFLLFAVYSGVPWQHTAASVPGHVPPHGGRRRDVHDRHAQRVQPPSTRAQKIRPEGERSEKSKRLNVDD